MAFLLGCDFEWTREAPTPKIGEGPTPPRGSPQRSSQRASSAAASPAAAANSLVSITTKTILSPLRARSSQGNGDDGVAVRRQLQVGAAVESSAVGDDESRGEELDQLIDKVAVDVNVIDIFQVDPGDVEELDLNLLDGIPTDQTGFKD